MTAPQTFGASHPQVSALVESLFPLGAAAADVCGPVDARLLHPEEAAAVAGSVPKRVADFAAGRLCARLVLERFGIAGFPLRANGDRTPRWPDGIVGSITHTVGYCGAVAASRERFAALGLDAEVRSSVTPDLWPQILTPAELGRLHSHASAERPELATIVFSAKEAFYKAQFAVTGAWLDFADVEVCLLPDGPRQGGLSVSIVAPVAFRSLPERASGRYRTDGNVVLAGIAIAPAPRSPKRI